VLTIDHTRGYQASLNWLLYDGHGNWVRTMSSSYALSENWQWRGVWGEAQSSLGTGRGYCANLGHPEDETGLVYMRARYYEPVTGRFISEDPARDGVNWYLYADGNPVNKVDESGRNPLILVGAVLGFISGFFIGLTEGKGWGHAFLTGLIGAISGAIAGAIGLGFVAWLGEGTKALALSGIVGGAVGSGLNTLIGDLLNGRGVNWGHIGRAMGIGGVLGLAFGAIGAAAQSQAELAGWLAAIDADLVGNATTSFLDYF